MAGGLVNIVLRSVSQGNGWQENVDNAKKLTAQMSDMGGAAKKFGRIFGSVGSSVGDLLSNVLKGGIFGIAAGLADLGVKAWMKWREAAEEAAKKSAEALERQQAYIDNFVSAVKKASDTELKWISHDLSLNKQRIDSVKDLTRATLELEKAMARAMGDTSKMSEIDKRMEEEVAKAERKKLELELAAAQKRQAQAEKDKANFERAQRAQDKTIKNIGNTMQDNRDKARKKASWWTWNNERENVEEYEASEAHKKLQEDRRTARDKKSDLSAKITDAKQRAEKAAADIQQAQNAIEAFDTMQAARKINAEQDAIDKAEEERRKEEEETLKKEAEEVRKFNAEKARLEKEIAAQRKAIEKEVAAEREKRERELHKKRMDDLREELAAQQKSASALTARAASVRSEFDRAFAMYRDPERAAAEIGEEKDYRSDLERLHKDARRYGGKWRIDELSRLMAAGDTQGVSDTLAEWRKSKGFTPQVEAMVRASAAENAKTTVEDELRKIDDKVASMNDVLKQMADAQSGKLGSIADNTSGLAEKVDQLLHVKG